MIEVLSYKDGMNLILKLASENNLIPIIGSGFTHGCKTANNNVPNGNELNELMKKSILNAKRGYTSEDIAQLNLTETSEIFFDEIPLDERQIFYADYFIDVGLPDHKVTFLRTFWPYIYTINIDDAIEKNTGYDKILTYSNFNPNCSKILKNKKFIFKLHGDALYEIKSNIQDNMIFSRIQYVRSLTAENKCGQLVNNCDGYNWCKTSCIIELPSASADAHRKRKL